MEENKNNNNQGQRILKNNLIRNILLCITILAIALIVLWVLNTGARGKETTYDNLVSKLETSSVERIEFDSKYIIAKYNDGNYYWIYNSNGVNEVILEKLTNGTYDMSKVQVVLGSATTFSIMNIIYPILMIAVLFIAFRMLMKQFGAANNRAFDFTKNRARITPSTVKFSDVAGADEEKAELEEIIEFLKNPDKFTKLGAKIPKGVILVGPPGTGKTLLAKACAGEANVPFFTISGSDFMELYVGVGASRVRDLFETAKKAKPCIIFIDEIDAVGRQRGAGLGGGSDEREQTLNQLLVQMDGFEPNEGIIVMAATNRVDILDPALLRPGRFDRRVFINIPDVKGREEIMKVHSRNKPLAKDVNLKHIARVTVGFTGADISNMLNEAALIAAKAKKDAIDMEDINNAIAKVTMGPQKRSHILSDNDKHITAVHEAGHAIVGKCVKNGDPIHEISIIPRGNAGGYTVSRPEKDETHLMKGKILDTITKMLGGRTAEKLFLYDITTGASNDIERATSIARSMVTEWGMSEKLGLIHLGSESSEVFIGRDYSQRNVYSEKMAAEIDEEVKKIIDNCAKQAEDILSKNADKLKTMVELLLEKETIYQDEVDMVMQGKTKEEILEAIAQKTEEDKKKKEEKKLSVDELISKAEEQEKLLAEGKTEKKVTKTTKSAPAKSTTKKTTTEKSKPAAKTTTKKTTTKKETKQDK